MTQSAMRLTVSILVVCYCDQLFLVGWVSGWLQWVFSHSIGEQ